MLVEFCAAVGLHPFEETFYSPDAYLIESGGGEVHRRASYSEAQANLHIA
jgi:hypothetical protein